MRKLLLLALCFFGFIALNAQTLERQVFIDFGTNVGTNGQITPSPDANGNYWNNPINAAVGQNYNLVSATNASTGFSMEVTDNFVVNTSTNYGPTLPGAALGSLAIATATMDYWYLETAGSANNTGKVVFHNLNPAKGYKFYIFGSRPTTSIRRSSYALNGLNSYSGQLQTSDGGTGNLNNVFASDMVYPNASGDISLDVAILEGGYAYLNAMRVAEFGNLAVVDVAAIAVNGNDISTSGQTSQMTATVSPSNATFASVVWSVDNTSVAVVNSSGVLLPVNDGTVVVTATSASNPAISGSRTIQVSNQVGALYFSGSATENGDNPSTAIAMHRVTGTNNVVSNIYEIYTSLGDGTFRFYTSQNGGGVYGMGATAGTLALNGPAIDPAESGPVRITVNLTNNTYAILPISWSVIGSSTPNGWSGNGLPISYQGNGVWSATVDLTSVTTDANPRFVFRANNGWTYVFKKVTGSQNSVVMESQANEFGIAMSDIDLTYGNFVITLNLGNYTYGIQCVNVDQNQITLMGSSVLNGQGATNMQGYAYQYNQVLAQRATQGSSALHTSNHAINGNNTTAVMNRFEKDLLGDCAKYVFFGLALGNEGIHENGQPAYDSYGANLQTLLQMSTSAGKIPVVANNYSRGDYNAADYAFVKQMNIAMAQWNAPSVNLLGANDNGNGNWVSGYWDDTLHPNSIGHTEMMFTIVPSLFDALEAGKPQPSLSTSTKLSIDNTTYAGAFKFTPDNTVHAFTTVLDVKTTSTGELIKLATATGNASLSIDASGHLKYASAAGTIVGTSVINDGNWHKVTLTHYHARGETLLYSDANLNASQAESIVTSNFEVNTTLAPMAIDYRNWFVYRSGMNTDEIAALNNNLMLKSSLELYAPLDDSQTSEAIFANLAQSTVAIDAQNFLSVSNPVKNKVGFWPNPVKDVLNVSENMAKIEVFNMVGQKIKSAKNVSSISLAGIGKGIYLVTLTSEKGLQTVKVVKD